jgi:hypothetical protein
LIPLSLALTVVFNQRRILLTTLLLIIGMLVPPLLLAFAHDLAILGVGRQLLAVIIALAPALTLWLTADPLLGTIYRRYKRTLAVRTAAGLVQADSSELEGEISEENPNHDQDARETKTDFTLRRTEPLMS